MKRVISRTLVWTICLYSCKSSQVNFNQSGTEVTYIGYMKGGKPSFPAKTTVVKKKTTAEKNIARENDKNNILSSTDFVTASFSVSIQNTTYNYPANATKEIGVKNVSEEEILLYAIALKKYAKENGFDTLYAFLANMGQLSTTKRLYLVDLSALKIVDKGLVSHGRGKGATMFVKQYSNEPGSNCTALGKYKIMDSYRGNYGYSYRMNGLETSNNNAYKRNIVLHAMSCIPDRENYAPACVSEGCPAVSKQFLSTMQQVIESRKESLLFWIFDSLLQQAVVETNELPSTTNDYVVKNK